MNFIPSASLVKQSLSSHSWLGLMVGALMYLVCLSGTLAVFYPELERWEQPQIQETQNYDPAVLERAYHEIVASGVEVTEHMFVNLPSPESPRASISSEKEGWFINPDGSRGELVNHEWTHLLINLHLYLHLPESFGMYIVSALGAILCGLIVSGLIAHPRIFKDAFVLRLGGSKHLEQADIHNRLSVWSSPFQLMIAITGAYFGLAQVISMVFAGIYTNGDIEKLFGQVFGEEPKLEQKLTPIALSKAINQTREMAPGTTPLYVTIEEAGKPEQFLLVGTQLPDRLIYVEQYRFDTAGNFIDRVGYTDGPPGRQIVYSTYRLHFGHFGGFGVQLLYFILGLAMSIVSVTGFNVWLAKRKKRDFLNNVWAGFVWGTVPALALSAIALVLLGIPGTPVFWIVVAIACAIAHRWNDETLAKRRLQMAGAVTIAALIVGYVVKFGAAAFTPVPIGVNASMLAGAAVLLMMGMKRATPAVTSLREPDPAAAE
ncbi:MAG TPA: PepSY-associated TM helix domain-containing protein [Steroidobacter sp.]